MVKSEHPGYSPPPETTRSALTGGGTRFLFVCVLKETELFKHPEQNTRHAPEILPQSLDQVSAGEEISLCVCESYELYKLTSRPAQVAKGTVANRRQTELKGTNVIVYKCFDAFFFPSNDVLIPAAVIC